MNTGFTPPRATPQATVLSVSALNLAVSQLLEKTIPLTWVSGEISNFTRAASGHWYFSLKDQNAQVRAVMFRGRAHYADFQPREGDKVEVRAQVTLYAPRGDYQLNVEAIRRAGSGDLYEAFLRLKAQLAQEGLFDAERKRTLPRFVRRIGIITSPQAAALRDVLSTLARRAPHVEVILYPTPVQGEAAIAQITKAIQTASNRNECDVLLLCRGGGSMEDLWCFNAEAVARAIAACELPIIAGIGHETDFTIADFAADLRAATPTAAAELATVPRAEWLQELRQYTQDLQRAMRRQLSTQTQNLDWLNQRLLSPAQAIKVKRMQLQGLARQLSYNARAPLEKQSSRLQQWQLRWKAQRPDLRRQQQTVQQLDQRLTRALQQQQQAHRQGLASLSAQLEMLNPQRTLERGYAILSDQHGKLIRSSKQIQPKQTLQLRLAEDSSELTVAAVQARLT